MNLIIRKATIIDKKSAFNNQTVDIKITDGKFEAIGNEIPKSEGHEEIVLNNLSVSCGWFDSSVSLGEPGF